MSYINVIYLKRNLRTIVLIEVKYFYNNVKNLVYSKMAGNLLTNGWNPPPPQIVVKKLPTGGVVGVKNYDNLVTS